MPRQRVKVLLFTVSLGGVRQHIADILSQIDHERFELMGVFPDRLLNRTYLPNDADGYQAMFAQAGCKVFTVEAPTGLQPLACAAAVRDMARLLRTVRPDVLHCHSSMAGAVGRLASLVWRPRRIIYTPHLMFYLRYTGVRRAVFAALERLLLPLCDWQVAVSASEYHGIADALGRSQKLVLIRNAIPRDLASASPRADCGELPADLDVPPGKKIILSTARFDSQKDVPTLVRAAAMLARSRNDFVVLLAGDGEERDQVADLIRNQGAGDVVRILGWRSDVHKLLEACHMMVLSSRNEGLPYALLEAMALEKPVVGSNVAGVRDCIDPDATGILFPCGDVPALARAMERLLDDAALCATMGAKGREMVLCQFSPKTMIQSLEALYAGEPLPAQEAPPATPAPAPALRS